MGYFPFFIEIAEKRGVILGGGKHAALKAEKLLPFGPKLTVIASEMDARMEELAVGASGRMESAPGQMGSADAFGTVPGREAAVNCDGSVTLVRRDWAVSDLEGADFVIAALPDAAENARAARWCMERRILVNAVDQPEDCGFYFPAIVRDGPVTVAVSSDGKSPAAAGYVRRKAEAVMPEGIGAAAELLGQLRPEVMERVPDVKERMKLLEELLTYCLERDGAVTLEELRRRMEELRESMNAKLETAAKDAVGQKSAACRAHENGGLKWKT